MPGQERLDGSGRVDTMVVSKGEPEAWDMGTYPSRGIEVHTDFKMSAQRSDRDPEASSQEGIIVRF